MSVEGSTLNGISVYQLPPLKTQGTLQKRSTKCELRRRGGCLSAVFWTCMDLVLVDSQHLASQDKTTTGSGQLIVYSGWVRGSCSPTLAEAMSIYWGRENLFVCVWVWPQEACPCSSGWLHHIHNYMKSTDWTQCDI